MTETLQSVHVCLCCKQMHLLAHHEKPFLQSTAVLKEIWCHDCDHLHYFLLITLVVYTSQPSAINHGSDTCILRTTLLLCHKRALRQNKHHCDLSILLQCWHLDSLIHCLPMYIVDLAGRVAENILRRLFPRVQQEVEQPQRFKGMVKVQNTPECRKLVAYQEFHLPLIECAIQLVHCITALEVRGQELNARAACQSQRS